MMIEVQMEVFIAAKNYVCAECNKEIEAGSEYNYCTLFDAAWFALKLHPECTTGFAERDWGDDDDYVEV